MLKTFTTRDELFQVLKELMKIPSLKNFRLVGGTALSLLQGHRKSEDIDLFTFQPYGSVDFTALENDISRKFPSVINDDPVPTLAKVSCPVLALNGSKDVQVPSKENLAGISDALKKGGNDHVTIKELPNLNHLFQECETGMPDEYSKIDETFSPIALSEISNWIPKQVEN